MVHDAIGFTEIYSSNLLNPQNIYIYNPAMIKYYKASGDLSDMHVVDSIMPNEEVFAFGKGNKNGKFYIYSTSGYNPSLSNRNFIQNTVNKFMQDSKDWLNVEVSLHLLLVNSLSNDVFSIKVRGGEHEGVRNELGCGIGFELAFDGKIRIVKEMRHYDNIVYTDWLADIGDIQGKWIGAKLCVYNTPDNEAVKVEVYVDPTHLNVWEKVCEIVDDGKGRFGGRGVSSTEQLIKKILFGGPVITLEWNNVSDPDGFQMHHISVREIDPNKQGAFRDMSTVATTIAEERGKRLYSGSIGSPLLISGTSAATVNNYGVENRYGTGRILYS